MAAVTGGAWENSLKEDWRMEGRLRGLYTRGEGLRGVRRGEGEERGKGEETGGDKGGEKGGEKGASLGFCCDERSESQRGFG